MSRAIISLNAGSSSIKFALFTLEDGALIRAARGKLEEIGVAPRLIVRDASGTEIAKRDWPHCASLTHEELLDDLYRWADGHLHHEIVAVGHRVVHGGADFVAPVRVDAKILGALETLCPLAPLHQPHNLAAIRAITGLAPGLPQIACFDTAFHHGMAEVATRIALPETIRAKGLRRYGFHGLSYEYVARRLREIDPKLAEGRVIVAHLGNGASLCEMAGGRSVDTTMGFTALDGMVMGTRCGAVDPGGVLHLIEREGMSARDVEAMLYKQSGLLGLSGVSSDMRTLHASAEPDAAAAIQQFVWSAARHAASLVASLGGLDGLVFTAGIGENDPLVRAAICERLSWLGIAIDPHANAANAPIISAPGSGVPVRVIPTDQERMIARHCLTALEGGA